MRVSVDTPLRRWRLSQGLTQQQLADRLGVARNTISRVELGYQQPRLRQLRALMARTHLPVEAFENPAGYLTAHPEYCAAQARCDMARGRPPTPRP